MQMYTLIIEPMIPDISVVTPPGTNCFTDPNKYPINIIIAKSY